MEAFFDEEKVGMEEAVSILGVCAATVRNWVRHRYLDYDTVDGKLAFDLRQLNELKEKVVGGEINRLNRRANKKHSAVSFIPLEYAERTEVVSAVEKISEIFRRENLDLESTLLAVILRILEKQGLIARIDSRDLISMGFKSQFLRKEIEWWFERAGSISSSSCACLFTQEIPVVRDFVGVLYQSLAKEGAKASTGSYYTPNAIVDEIVSDNVVADSVLLDPCCGSGQFLLAAAERIENPVNLWGFDIDEMAVRIARINLLIRFPDREFSPHIYCKNTLLAFPFHARMDGKDLPLFDVVLTNPPWGVHFTAQEISQLQVLFPTIRSKEAFALFLCKGLQLLKEGGLLSYILPEAILNIKVHSDVRGFVLRKTKVRQVHHLGRIFQNVFSPAVRLDLTKEKPAVDNRFLAKKNVEHALVEQSRLANNADCVFDLFTTDKDSALFAKLYSHKHVTLEGNADWALGIVTGDNDKYLLDYQAEHYEPILTGKDLRRFSAQPARKFIQFIPQNFQQVAPAAKYRVREKLLYRFISNELVFAYDNKQMLSLNSANILIPRVDGYPIKSILAFLNCSLYQLLFQKKVGAFKILRGDIEKLPFPVIAEAQHNQICASVELLLASDTSNARKKVAFAALDDYIMEIVGFTSAEKAYILSTAKVSSKFFPFS